MKEKELLGGNLKRLDKWNQGLWPYGMGGPRDRGIKDCTG